MAGALATAATLGVPTGVITNPWFERKVPVRGFEIVVLVVLSAIAALFATTYAQPSDTDARPRTSATPTRRSSAP